MGETTTIRVSRVTRDELNELATEAQITLAEAVARGARLLRQERMGVDLSHPLTAHEVQWLDADAG